MLKDCRECGHPVAARAKTCPHCGVKKPTATKAEANLDAFAGATAKLAFLIMALVVIVVVVIGIVAGCTTGDTATPAGTPAATPATAPTTQLRATTTRSPATTIRVTTTTDPRPDYCTDYDTWTAADAEMDGLERRHGVDVSTWPAADVDRLFAAMDRRAAAVERVWAQADESATISSVRAACTG